MSNAAMIRTEPHVEIQLHARPDKTWFWVVRVFSSQKTLVNTDWCDQISFGSVDGRDGETEKRIMVTAGALAEHQALHLGSLFDPSEVAKLARDVYRELCDDLENKHGTDISRH